MTDAAQKNIDSNQLASSVESPKINASNVQKSNVKTANRLSLNEIFFQFYVLIEEKKRIIQESNEDIIHVSIRNDLEKFLRMHANYSFKISNAFEKNSMDAIYAMASFADEEMLNFDWDGRAFWEKNLLEYVFFNTHIAGDEIFNKIDQLLQEANILSIDNAELYMNMLALGFQGKYIDDENKINEYRANLYKFVVHLKDNFMINNNVIFGNRHLITHQIKKYLPDPQLFMHYFIVFCMFFCFITTLIWIFETDSMDKLVTEIESILILNGDK